MTAPLRRTFAHTPPPQIRPNLTQLQHRSFDWLVDPIDGGLRRLFDEVGAMSDHSGNIRVEFGEMTWGERSATVRECKAKDMTFSKPLHVKVSLTMLDTGEIMEQLVFFGDMPWMTPRGTFVVGGTERVVINQLVRAPGAYIMPGKEGKLLQAALMPSRGSWLDMELDRKGRMQVRIDRKKRFPYSILLSALGYSKEEVLAATDDSLYLRRTYEEAGEYTMDADAAAIEIFKRQRPGEPPSVDGARALVDGLFFDPKRYDLTPVGRYKLNQRLGLDLPADQLTLGREDLLGLAVAFANIPRVLGIPEDDEHAPADVYAAARGLSVHHIDHLIDEYEHFANRRVRAVGELVQESMRIGWQRSERAIRERLTVQDRNDMTPQSVVNVRPLIASIKEFFGSSQLSQFMDQDNALAGLTHRRRLSGLGPGGLTRERAPLEVRDVHPTHYGRMCPIETPEGPNIGLIGSLTCYASVNDYGFLTTPYRVVEGGKITEEIVWFDAGEEASRLIAPASTDVDGDSIVETSVLARTGGGRYITVPRDEIEFIDLSTDQLWSISTGLIPFLEHDDANRALMGSNMQRQAVPLVRPRAPLIGTGMESWIGRDSGESIVADVDGEVSFVDATSIRVRAEGEEHEYELDTWQRSNQGTLIHQRPLVRPGERVSAGDVLADGASTDGGEIALGRNLTVAFMPWEGYNFEDSIILSSKVVTENMLTSVHIESYEIEARDTKLGKEDITRDIPNRSEESLRNLDDHGVIRVGAKVGSGDVLVGKVTPKGDTDLTAEEKLIRAIFKEQAKEVRDTSLKVPHGSGGTVIDVKTFSRGGGDDLQPGVHELIRVFVAQRRPIREGDKLAGRHGNKGVVSKIVPVHDMPHLADGTAVDIILNPLGVPSRMNIGQILETHLGWVSLNGFGESDSPIPVATPVFNGAGVEEVDAAMLEYAKRRPEQGMIIDETAPAGRRASGTYTLYSGRTGEPFDRPVTVGVMYILKLHHLVDDKIHARSTGPYSLITQQPLGGKAQFGGQRFGEMEVWALEAYGAAYTLQEMLTIKSDDVVGRVKAYEAIVKGENIEQPSVPESFRVLLKEMQALGLSIELIAEEDPEADAEQLAEEDAFLRAAEDLAFSLAGFEPQAEGLPAPTDARSDAQAETE